MYLCCVLLHLWSLYLVGLAQMNTTLSPAGRLRSASRERCIEWCWWTMTPSRWVRRRWVTSHFAMVPRLSCFFVYCHTSPVIFPCLQKGPCPKLKQSAEQRTVYSCWLSVLTLDLMCVVCIRQACPGEEDNMLLVPRWDDEDASDDVVARLVDGILLVGGLRTEIRIPFLLLVSRI